MKKFIESLITKLTNLYRLFENYIWKNDEKNIKIDILFQDNMICFYLYDEKEKIDEFIMNFNEKEYRLYKYVSLRLILNILGNVLIYNDNNSFFNRKHKPYLNVVINDDIILECALYIKERQKDEIINADTEYILGMYKEIPRRLYPHSFLDNIERRIGVSKKILEVKR